MQGFTTICIIPVGMDRMCSLSALYDIYSDNSLTYGFSPVCNLVAHAECLPSSMQYSNNWKAVL